MLQEYKSLSTTIQRFRRASHERNRQKKTNIRATDAQTSLLERFEILSKSMALDRYRPTKSPPLNITNDRGTKRSFRIRDGELH
mmetsp:Transcript_16793/g.34615  ORF Transcript_16793/g.34615 Transcript_16793/m.34615 type:complete len:84 (-) Transcript_16793:472-723(-)